MKKTYSIGAPAYFDSFGGLVPCKVTGIFDAIPQDSDLSGCSTMCRIFAKVTANRGAYLRGEIIESTALNIVPRSFVRVRKYGSRILGGYSWK
jgi:hypothetical protein